MQQYNEGRISPFDLKVLEELLDSFGRRDLVCLEIGSWFGAGSTQVIAKYARTFVCIDHWMGNANAEHREIVSRTDVFERFRHNVKEFGDVIVPMRAHSGIACGLLGGGQFDFIFIDGDHRYEATLNDIRATKRLVRSGGILSGHDCEGRVDEDNEAFLYANGDKDHTDSIYSNFKHCHPGVIRAVHEEFDNANLFAESPMEADGRQGCSSIWWSVISHEDREQG